MRGPTTCSARARRRRRSASPAEGSRAAALSATAYVAGLRSAVGSAPSLLAETDVNVKIKIARRRGAVPGRVVLERMSMTTKEPTVLKSEQEWREQLTPAQYEVLRKAGTEPPFTGEYVHNKASGDYRCAACST